MHMNYDLCELELASNQLEEAFTCGRRSSVSAAPSGRGRERQIAKEKGFLPVRRGEAALVLISGPSVAAERYRAWFESPRACDAFRTRSGRVEFHGLRRLERR